MYWKDGWEGWEHSVLLIVVILSTELCLMSCLYCVRHWPS